MSARKYLKIKRRGGGRWGSKLRGWKKVNKLINGGGDYSASTPLRFLKFFISQFYLELVFTLCSVNRNIMQSRIDVTIMLKLCFVCFVWFRISRAIDVEYGLWHRPYTVDVNCPGKLNNKLQRKTWFYEKKLYFEPNQSKILYILDKFCLILDYFVCYFRHLKC